MDYIIPGCFEPLAGQNTPPWRCVRTKSARFLGLKLPIISLCYNLSCQRKDSFGPVWHGIGIGVFVSAKMIEGLVLHFDTK